MPQIDKRVLVLRFFADHDLPFKPKALYGAMIYQQDVTFAYRTLQGIVRELTEEGYLLRVEIDQAAGEVRPLPEDTNRHAYYVLTDEGRERALADK